MNELSFYVEGCISEKEFNNLKESVSTFRKKAFIAGLYSKKGANIDKNFRDSSVYFPKVSEFKYGFNLLQSLIITNYYDIYSNLDYDLPCEIQYCLYKQGGKFKKHRDNIIINSKKTIRCLTMSINISEENCYEGGELLIFTKDGNKVLSKKPGSFVIFPSFYFHEACEVLKGERESIVIWLHSKNNIFYEFRNTVQKLV